MAIVSETVSEFTMAGFPEYADASAMAKDAQDVIEDGELLSGTQLQDTEAGREALRRFPCRR